MDLVKNHGLVCVEDLKITGLTASAKGTREQPGRNVKRKAALNRVILRVGWGNLFRMLDYKLDWSGGKLIAVAPPYTSCRCSACGKVAASSRRSQAVFVCVECGHHDNADVNAARNILKAGLSLPGEIGRHQAA